MQEQLTAPIVETMSDSSFNSITCLKLNGQRNVAGFWNCRDAKDAESALIDVGLGKRINNFPAQLCLRWATTG